MWANYKQKTGFTIVELLIVIVVIAILGTIGITAYTSMQQRGKNTQTRQALSSWIKAINLYKKDKGTLPSGNACLGTGYKYALSSTDSSSQGQCRQTGANSRITESSDFNTVMQPYVNSTPLPTPAFVTTRNTDTNWLRGIAYILKDGDAYIQAAYAGQLSSCPTVAGVTATYAAWDDNTNCQYKIGLAPDF